jgi:hypothetical protein
VGTDQPAEEATSTPQLTFCPLENISVKVPFGSIQSARAPNSATIEKGEQETAGDVIGKIVGFSFWIQKQRAHLIDRSATLERKMESSSLSLSLLAN